jgi:hypothetical protein
MTMARGNASATFSYIIADRWEQLAVELETARLATKPTGENICRSAEHCEKNEAAHNHVDWIGCALPILANTA